MDYGNDPMALFDNPSRLGLSSYNSFLTYPALNHIVQVEMLKQIQV